MGTLSGKFNWEMQKAFYTSKSGFVPVIGRVSTWLTAEEKENYTAVASFKLNIPKTQF
jgi:hypothetical protein